MRTLLLLVVVVCSACGSASKAARTPSADPLVADLAAHADLARVTAAARVYFEEHDTFEGFAEHPIEGVTLRGDVPAAAGVVSINLATDRELVYSSQGAPGHGFCGGIRYEPLPPGMEPSDTTRPGEPPTPLPEPPRYMVEGAMGASDAQGATPTPPNYGGVTGCGPEGSETLVPNDLTIDRHIYAYSGGWIGEPPPECTAPSELKDAGHWPLTSLGRVTGAKYDGGTGVFGRVTEQGDGAEMLVYQPDWDPNNGTTWMRLTDDCLVAYNIRNMA
jgi:hypothetical protein